MTILKKRVTFLMTVLILLWGGVFFSFFISHRSDENRIVVGGKNHSEQLIIAEMISIMLERHTDLKVKRSFQLEGTLICFEALRSSDIDLYCEYTGTALMHILRMPFRAYSKEQIYAIVKEDFAKRFGFEWMPPFGCDNQYVVIMQEEVAQKYNVKSLSDLHSFQKNKNDFSFSFDSEFSSRPELKMLEQAYHIDASYSPLMEKMLAYLALSKGGIDAMIAFGTDGLLSRFPLRVLEDDKHVLPPYDMAAVVRKEILKKHPEVKDVLHQLSGKISDQMMQKLNDAVENKGKSYEDVAKRFLKSHNLI